MTRLEQLENRLEGLKENKDFYTKSIKVGGKLYANPKAGKYMSVVYDLKKAIRNLENN